MARVMLPTWPQLRRIRRQWLFAGIPRTGFVWIVFRFLIILVPCGLVVGVFLVLLVVGGLRLVGSRACGLRCACVAGGITTVAAGTLVVSVGAGLALHGGVAFATLIVAGVGRRSLAAMAGEVGEGFGVVADHGVEIQSLRIGEVGVGNGSWDGGPVGGEPASEAEGVVAGAEVVVAGFGVALFF
jgi:hypothetical protein